ncbi:alpha/beta hydrolase family protein [Gynurincola endophyticus]|uniref:alpha/beta hydrolase family protein n=1 Tax=Gynurincola endophyticus TaxID=2479004 RepID=UPI000F8F1E17|nr:acyl-CoA thioester hydrolase/BAAT C-terminal domain-containing protein [Gynurincola endophyticus]
MRYLIFSIILILINSQILNGQLSNDYIQKYKEEYDSNIPMDLKLSSTGKSYIYKYNNDTLIVHVNNKKIKIHGNTIFSIIKNTIYIDRNKELLKITFSSGMDYNVEKLGDIKKYQKEEDEFIVELTDNTIYVLNMDTEKKIHNIQKVERYNIDKEYMYIFKKKSFNIILKGKKFLTINENINQVITGPEETLIVSKSHLYIISNNLEKLLKEKNNISHILEDLNKRIITEKIYFDNNIIIKKEKDTTTIKEYFISSSILDINYFLELTSNQTLQKIKTIESINIKTGETKQQYKYLNRLLTPFSNESKLISKNSFLELNNIFHIYKEELIQETHIHNKIFNKTIRIDSLVNDVESYEPTTDGRYIYICNKKRNIIRYDFKKDTSINIFEKFEFKKNNIDLQENRKYIEINAYNPIQKKTYISSEKKIFIVDSNGKVNVLKNTLKKNDYKNSILVNMPNDTSYIIYSLNERNGNSEIEILTSNSTKVISSNDSYKFPYNRLYYPNIDSSRGFFRVVQDKIVWSETNLLKGTSVFIYDLNSKTKKKLDILYEKKYDSLEYNIFSYENEDRIVMGGIKYPKKFDRSIKYPLIISIYLNKMHGFHFISNISNSNYEIQNISSNGLMNELNLLHQGYAICYIDLPFQDGIYSSNSNLVNEIIKKIISTIPNIDKDNIGILGHSRSAGQVLGVLTNDTIVKCSIISNGILSELLDISQFTDYEIVSKNETERHSRFTRKTMYTFNSKYNMYRDIHNNYEEILKRDPFFKLQQIKSSILFLLNDNDATISSNNGYLTYIKTKLLEKNTYLLNFHKEGHSIYKREIQESLYLILIDYLNYFLKDKNSKESFWIPNFNKKN